MKLHTKDKYCEKNPTRLDVENPNKDRDGPLKIILEGDQAILTSVEIEAESIEDDDHKYRVPDGEDNK